MIRSKTDDTEPLLNKDESSDDFDDEELQIKNEYQEAFQIFDKDRTGTLSDKDLLVVLRALGQDPSEEEFHEILSKVDKGNTGKISFQDFINFILSQTNEFSARAELQDCFNLFTDDPNKSFEFNVFLSILKAPPNPFKKEHMDKIISKFNDLSKIDDYINTILNEPIDQENDSSNTKK